jgi:hypothetical protein
LLKPCRKNSNSLRSDSEFFQHNANSRKLSIATPPVDVSENKYFPALYNGFTGRREREGIGDRGKDEMYVCRNGRLQDLVRVCYSKGN